MYIGEKSLKKALAHLVIIKYVEKLIESCKFRSAKSVLISNNYLSKLMHLLKRKTSQSFIKINFRFASTSHSTRTAAWLGFYRVIEKDGRELKPL